MPEPIVIKKGDQLPQWLCRYQAVNGKFPPHVTMEVEEPPVEEVEVEEPPVEEEM